MFKDLADILRKKSTFWFGLFFLINIIYALTRHSVDFYQFWLISRNAIFLKGYDIYVVNSDFSQPPFQFCVFSLFSILTYKTALLFWNIFQVTLMTFTVILTARIMGYGERADGGWNEGKYLKNNYYVIPLMMVALMVCDNIWLGQINIPVFFLSVAAIYNHLKGRSWAAGLLIAAAISIKVTPALFLIYFIYKKDYSVLPWALGGLFVFLGIIPCLYYGFEGGMIYLQDFYGYVIKPFFGNAVSIRGTTGFYHSNQSIDGFLGRHFTDFGIKEYTGNLLFNKFNVKFGDLHKFTDPANMTLLEIKRIGLYIKLFLVALAGLAFTNNAKKRPHLVKFEIALVFLLILMLSPASWLNYFVTCFFGYFVAVNYIRDAESNIIGKYIMLVSLVLCLTLTALLGPEKTLQSFSGMFMGHFILMSAMFAVLFIEKSRQRKIWAVT